MMGKVKFIILAMVVALVGCSKGINEQEELSLYPKGTYRLEIKNVSNQTLVFVINDDETLIQIEKGENSKLVYSGKLNTVNIKYGFKDVGHTFEPFDTLRVSVNLVVDKTSFAEFGKSGVLVDVD